jgi:hypothetical protein
MRKESWNLSKYLFLLFTAITSIILGAGYGIAGLWFVEILLLLLLVLTFIAIKIDWNWVFSVVLIINSILAAVGIELGVSSFLMIAGITTALASWELSNSEKKFRKIYSHSMSNAFEKNRFRLLGISLGSGLLVAEIALFIHLQLPFVVIYIITIIILFCFYQVYRLLNQPIK